MIPIPPRVWLYAGAAAVIAAGVWYYGHTRYNAGEKSQAAETAKAEKRLSDYEKTAAESIARFETEARATEQRHAADLNRIDQEARDNAKQAGDAAYSRAVADVRSGRLRNVWSCPAAAQVSRTAASASEPDGADGLRGESAGRIVRAVAECQAQRDGLIEVTASDRER